MGQTERCPSFVRECPGPQKFDDNNDVAWLVLSGCYTLGVTWYSTSTDEADIAMNTNFGWATDGANDFEVETVYLHENGHVADLGHPDVDGAVMEAIYVGPRRILHADYIGGINTLYPAVDPNESPVMTIISPADGDAFESGVSIAFAGTATDTEDDDTSMSVAWDSSINGVIGSEAWFSTTLSDGVHSITATATDSVGATGSHSISILVGSPPDEATSVDVVVVSYNTSGGKTGTRTSA